MLFIYENIFYVLSYNFIKYIDGFILIFILSLILLIKKLKLISIVKFIGEIVLLMRNLLILCV